MPYKSVEVRRHNDLNKYHTLRNALIKELGGICVDCGSENELEFDHDDPKQKNFNINRILKDQVALILELDKIKLRCNSCHKKKTTKQARQKANDRHGLGRTAYNNCGPPKCEACRIWRYKSNGGHRVN